MAVRDDEVAARTEQARAIGLFRYELIREAADPGLSSKARGRLVRQIAAGEHTDPAGRRRRISRDTLDRWIRAWRRGGFDALVPDPRQSAPRLPVEVIEMAVSLKRENPARTATQVRRILRAQMGWAPGERTLQRHFADDPQDHRPDARRTRRRRPRQRSGVRAVRSVTARTSCGPVTPCTAPPSAGRKTYLFAFLDDHSRAIIGPPVRVRRGHRPPRRRAAPRARPRAGSPTRIYVDNGSAFVDAWLLRACAKLGIRLIHSTPGRPQGRGKIERFFRTVREQFLVEITGEPTGRGPPTAAGTGSLTSTS